MEENDEYALDAEQVMNVFYDPNQLDPKKVKYSFPLLNVTQPGILNYMSYSELYNNSRIEMTDQYHRFTDIVDNTAHFKYQQVKPFVATGRIHLDYFKPIPTNVEHANMIYDYKTKRFIVIHYEKNSSHVKVYDTRTTHQPGDDYEGNILIDHMYPNLPKKYEAVMQDDIGHMSGWYGMAIMCDIILGKKITTRKYKKVMNTAAEILERGQIIAFRLEN